eukprot:3868277-Prymnesium_polylepis.1
MAKAMGGELEAVREQTQAAQARVAAASEALRARTDELETIRADRATTSAALTARLDALGQASRGLQGYEAQIGALEATSAAKTTSTASLEQSA